jgi:hypothetical protein
MIRLELATPVGELVTDDILISSSRCHGVRWSSSSSIPAIPAGSRNFLDPR